MDVWLFIALLAALLFGVCVWAFVLTIRINERDGQIERERDWRHKAEIGERQAHKEATKWREKHAELRTRMETYLELDQM